MSVAIEDIKKTYIQFRSAQSLSKKRGFRIPKDFEKFINTKKMKYNKKSLIRITKFFRTKWSDIDQYTYFLCGFELYKGFTYRDFNNDNKLQKVMLLYIQKDKNRKREIDITKKGLINSAKFVIEWMRNNNKNFNEYIHHRDGKLIIAVDHYLKNKIDASFFVFLIRQGMILTDNDRSLIPYIQAKYRKINFGLNDINDFIKKMEVKFNEYRT